MNNNILGKLKLVFVYGSLKKGYCNHCLLDNSDMLGTHITEPTYTMKDLGAYPAVLDKGTTPITGEVYQVNDDTFSSLDRLESYPDYYDRKVIETKYGDAWIYFIKEDSDWLGDNSTVDDGVWMER